MLIYRHSGFSVDASEYTAAHHRAGLERLRKAGSEMVCCCAKQHSEPGSDWRGKAAEELRLTPLELIERLAALVPPRRTHRHCYHRVLAPNSPLGAAVTALAAPQAAASPAQRNAQPLRPARGKTAS